MPFTPDEQQRINKILAAYYNPSVSGGDGFSPLLMVNLFQRIVTLRDFAAAQQVINAETQAKLRELEDRIKVLEGSDVPDAATVYLSLTPQGGDIHELGISGGSEP